MARACKEPKPQFAKVKSEVRRSNDSWWIKCPKDNWLEASVCHRSFMDANALKKKDHHCFNCQNGKEYRIMFAQGALDRTYYDMLFQSQSFTQHG